MINDFVKEDDYAVGYLGKLVVYKNKAQKRKKTSKNTTEQEHASRLRKNVMLPFKKGKNSLIPMHTII